MAMDIPVRLKPLFDALLEGCAARLRLSRRALRSCLENGNLFPALSVLPEEDRVDPAAVLEACLGSMGILCPQVPSQGWLPRIYAYLAHGIFPESGFLYPKKAERQAIELYVWVLEYLLEEERGCCPPSLLDDVCVMDDGELAASRIAGEYGRFLKAVRESRYLLLLRMARCVLPYDPASHIIGVHNVAVGMARQAVACGLPADVPLVAAASLAHDIGKFGCRGTDAARVPHLHYYYTWEWLTRQDMPETAHVAANHSTWDLEFQNLPLESLLLIYADFRVRGHMYENGKERVRIYTLKEAYGIIFSKLANMTEEKRRQYETVYHKLRDFEGFLQAMGVDPDPRGQARTTMPPDASLLSFSSAVDRLRTLTFYHNIRLMHTLSGQGSVEQLLDRARSEKDPQRLRTYLWLLEDYNVYMTRTGKLLALSFLYELLAHHEGDVRRHAGRIMGMILAGSGPRYRKELPSRAPKDASAPGVNEVFQEASALWESYIGQCLHPDIKISAKHALRISHSLKTITASVFAACAPQEASLFLSPLLRRALDKDIPRADRFVLLDALLHVPASLFSQKDAAALLRSLRHMLPQDGGDPRLAICALRLTGRLLEQDGPGIGKAALGVLSALPKSEEPAVLFLRGRMEGRLGRKARFAAVEASELYLSNLKNAVHWTVKLTYIDMLTEFAQTQVSEAFHVAMHLSNLLSVSEHLPVRERAGEALISTAHLLRADQRNEIVIDLIRELESGQDEISRYIPPYLGVLVCGLPQKELEECTGMLEALVRSSNINPARTALSTLGVMLRSLEDGALAPRILGLLLTGVAHYEDSIHRTALHVLCRSFFGEAAVPLCRRQAAFATCAKKLLTLLAQPRESRITFFNRAAMLNHLYRFITQCEVELGPWPFADPAPVAFFPGTFDPFSAGHRRIVDEIRALGFEVYLAVDEFSWNKRTLPKLLRRQIALMSVADAADVFLFPDDIPVNIAIPGDLSRLASLFSGRSLRLVMGSDVVFNASAYKHGLPGGAASYGHIVFSRVEDETEEARHAIGEKIKEELILLSLPAYYEGVSSTRIRESIDKSMDISMLMDPIVQDFIYARGLYLRSPQNKRLLTLESLHFTGGQDEADGNAYAFSLHSRAQEQLLGLVQARALPISGLYSALQNAAEAEALRRHASGRVLMLEECHAQSQEAARLLCNQLLARCLCHDITYAFFRSGGDDGFLPAVLPQMGFVPLPGAPHILLVDMRCPMALVQDALCRLKEPLCSDVAVAAAIRRRRSPLRLALASLFPGRLLLCFDTELLNQALMYKVQKWNGVMGVPSGERRLGGNMCVPYGKVLSGNIVPNTVTKALHAEKVFEPDLRGFVINESPGYSSLLNQVRTLKSFRRPVLLVDDLLHNGYRLEKLDPLFKQEHVPISRIIVAILSGRGLDLMRTQGREVDCEYFIPNLLYWFNESLLYPFIGGDGMGGRAVEVAGIPSINLLLPYAYPRYLHGADEKAIWALSRTALTNAYEILRVLEERHLGLSNGTLTIRRLGEAFIAPRLPDRGAHLSYDLNAAPSQCLAEDLAALKRLEKEL